MGEDGDTVSEAGRLALVVEGMTCQSCVGHVERALTAVGGEEVTVDLDSGVAELRLPDDVPVESAAAALRKAGYPASVR